MGIKAEISEWKGSLGLGPEICPCMEERGSKNRRRPIEDWDESDAFEKRSAG
jgi:hypothetical protein